MEYEITCVGNNISLGGALYLDQASAMRGEQTTRMLPGAVWEVSSQDIVKALKLKASDSNDPSVYQSPRKTPPSEEHAVFAQGGDESGD